MEMGGAALMMGRDGSVDSPRWPKKTTEDGSSRELAKARPPHGKDLVVPRPTPKHATEAMPARGKKAAKKVRRAIQAAPPRRAIPTVIG